MPPTHRAIFCSCILSALSLLGGACQNHRDEAAIRFEKELAARRLGRERSALLYGKGMEAFEKDDMDGAADHLERALAADSRNAAAWMALGTVRHRADDPYGAAKAFHRAARLSPDRYEPHYNLGKVLESVGKFTQAIREYENARQLAPDQVEVMENLARCYVTTQTKLNEAEKLIQRALQGEMRPEWVIWLKQQARKLEARRTFAPPQPWPDPTEDQTGSPKLPQTRESQ